MATKRPQTADEAYDRLRDLYAELQRWDRVRDALAAARDDLYWNHGLHARAVKRHARAALAEVARKRKNILQRLNTARREHLRLLAAERT